MVQDIVKSSLTQLRVIPQDTPTQSQAQSSTENPEPSQIEDISSEGEISNSDQEDPHSGTSVLNQLLMAVKEHSDTFPSPVVTKTPLWKFAEQTPSGSQTQLKSKTATTQAQPMTCTPVKPDTGPCSSSATGSSSSSDSASGSNSASKASSSLLLLTSGRSPSRG